MNVKLAIALLLLLSVTAGACVIKGGGREVGAWVEAPPLGVELARLKRAYKQGLVDERQYYAKRDMLVTAWELVVRDQKLSPPLSRGLAHECQ